MFSEDEDSEKIIQPNLTYVINIANIFTRKSHKCTNSAPIVLLTSWGNGSHLAILFLPIKYV